jgi:uncharacterized protein (DUF433 family)
MKIVRNPKIMSGSPSINSKRISVFNIIKLLDLGSSIEELSNDFELFFEKDDVKNLLSYCANRVCLNDTVNDFCENCTLDNKITKEFFESLKFEKIAKGIFKSAEQENFIYLTDAEQLDFQQENGWEIAQKLMDKL